MTNYGPSVGFRVSAEEFRSGAEGRQRVPLTAVGPNAIRQFDLVTFDPANPGFLRKAPADSPIEPGYTGLAVQESAHLGSIFDGPYPTADRLEILKAGETAVITSGAGLKIWLRNRVASQREGGQAVSAREVFVATGLVIGDLLKWDGAKYVETATAAQAVARVTLVNVAEGYLEAVLVK